MAIHRQSIVILGSTGSIGASCLEIVRQFPDRLDVLGLAAGSNEDLLWRQVQEFRPRMVAIADAQVACRLQGRLKKKGCVVFSGEDGVCRLAQEKSADTVIVGIVGSHALYPLRAAVRAGKTIALANKEALVMMGRSLMLEARRFGARIIPVDSEQSAIFQCLQGHDMAAVRFLHLTASGGPLVDWPRSRLRRVKPRDVLNHPRWNMGRKITLDSATLMNKGFEVIEASHLFGMTVDQIRVVIHRQALIHSMVEFVDGSILAQMGATDMRLPIQYALTYPHRWENERLRLDPSVMGTLSFEKPDMTRFRCLQLAYEALKGTAASPCVLNAANDVAVEMFLEEGLAFDRIPCLIEDVLKQGDLRADRLSWDSVMELDRLARQRARVVGKRMARRGMRS